ncbi:hypothetical protein [Glaciecola sp. 1036]|uniref:hypothetical protein n=1 Tax=Alteromonadaceae TaxID=72275 RepID=UPI003CFCB1BF
MKTIRSLLTVLVCIRAVFWTTLTNSDYSVVRKHPHTLRGLQNVGLLLIGLMCTLFGLQYMALSSFTGDYTFSLVAATLSVFVLIVLDRTVLDSHSHDEGRKEHLLETDPKSLEIDKIKKKIASTMVVRIGIGVTIAYIAATLSMSDLLGYEVGIERKALEAELNAASVDKMNYFRDEQYAIAATIEQQIESIEGELTLARAKEGDLRSQLVADVRKLQKEREQLQADQAFAQQCQAAELAGRIERDCRNTGRAGRGEIYVFWGKKKTAIETLIGQKTTLIAEKQGEIAESPERLTQSQSLLRLSELRAKRQGILENTESEIERMKSQFAASGEWQPVADGGVMAIGDLIERIFEKSSDTAVMNLFLLKLWVMVLELALFAAKLCGTTKEYSLALYRETQRRRCADEGVKTGQVLPLAV